MSEQAAVQAAASIDEAAASGIRTTAKWLCASAGAVVAVIVTGLLQWSNLEILDGTRLGVAVTAAAVALVSVLVVLLLAAAVLASEGPSIHLLSKMDKADGGGSPIRVDDPKTPLMKYLLVERRLEMLGPQMDSISALEVARIAAHDGLIHGKTVTIEDKTYTPATKTADRDALREVKEDIQGRITAVLNAADRWTVRKRFYALRIALMVAGVVFLASLVLFVWLISTSEPRAKISQPLPATILVPSDRDEATAAGFEEGCAGKSLSGVIIGGWLDQPRFVTIPATNCPAQELTPVGETIVIPESP